MSTSIPGVRFCEVLSVDDKTDAQRIKVRLLPEDASKNLSEIDYAFPLLPKHFFIKPKVGEGVLVLLAVTNKGESQRYYIGPVISQEHKINGDSFFCGADSILRGGAKVLDIPPRMRPEANGALPNDDDVIVRGRRHGEIQIREDDVIIKAGVKLLTGPQKDEMYFNNKNSSYIKTKYHLNPLNDGIHSTTTLVGDKIFLLSNNGEVEFKDNTEENKRELISDEQLKKVIDSAYKLPYGEKLVEFLKLFVEAFLSHSHPFPMLPPDPSYTSKLVAKKAQMLDAEEMLSDTVRIN